MSALDPTKADIRKAAHLIDTPVLDTPAGPQYLIYAGWLYKADPNAPLMRTKKLNRPQPDDWEIVPPVDDPLREVLRDAAPEPAANPENEGRRRKTL